MRFLSRCLLLWAVLGGSWTYAQKQPQDSFFEEGAWSHGLTSPTGIAVDYSNRVWIAHPNGIHVFTQNGVIVTNWTLSPGVGKGIRLDPTTNLVWVGNRTATTPQMRAYDENFNLQSSWGTNTLPTGAFAVGSGDLLYFGATNTIMMYSRQGTFSGSFANPNLAVIRDIGVGADGSVFVSNTGSLVANSSVTRFSSNGTYLSKFTLNILGAPYHAVFLAPTADGLVYGPGTAGIGPICFDLELNRIMGTGTAFPLPYNSAANAGCFSPDGGRLYLLTSNQVFTARRTYRTAGALTPNALPLPFVWNVAQVPGQPWVAADFVVNDADDAVVQAAAYAQVNGQPDLLSFVPVRTLLTNDGAVASLTNVATGIKQRLIWDAGADWGIQFGYIKLGLIAKDGRGLFDVHFLTCPAYANPNVTYTTPVTISQSPLQQSDFLSAWYWLICTSPDVLLTTGNVFAATDNYGVTNGTLLAQTTIGTTTNSVTTADGRAFLLAVLSSNLVTTVYSNHHVRIATTNEINQAKIGTTGNLTNVFKWTPRVQINGLPQTVNEFGFDTGLIGTNGTLPTNAWWLVLEPLP